MIIELDEEAEEMIQDYKMYQTSSYAAHLAKKIAELYDEQYGDIT